MTKINTSRMDRRQKQRDKSRYTYGTQKHIRIQQDIQERKQRLVTETHSKRKRTTKG